MAIIQVDNLLAVIRPDVTYCDLLKHRDFATMHQPETKDCVRHFVNEIAGLYIKHLQITEGLVP